MTQTDTRPAYRALTKWGYRVKDERDQARNALTKIAAFCSNRPPGGPWDTIKRLALEGWPEALDIPEEEPINEWVPI